MFRDECMHNENTNQIGGKKYLKRVTGREGEKALFALASDVCSITKVSVSMKCKLKR